MPLERSKLFLITALWGLLSGTARMYAQQPEVLDEIVAKVNSDNITLTDLKKELNALRIALREEISDSQALEKEMAQRKRELLKRMIEDRMMLQKAEEIGLPASVDSDVSAYLEQMRKENGIPDMQAFDRALQQRGSSLTEYREAVKKRMILDQLVGQFVYSKITLLSSEVEAYYKERIDQFTEPAQVELAEIVFLTEGRDKEQVRRKAREALDKLKAGTSFEDIARQYSDGPTAAKGGTIGSFKRGSMAPDLEAAVFQLKEGGISEILEADYGLQIVKIIKKQEPRQKPLEEVRPQIQQALYQKKAQPELEEFMQDLRFQSYVYIAPKYREEYDVSGL